MVGGDRQGAPRQKSARTDGHPAGILDRPYPLECLSAVQGESHRVTGGGQTRGSGRARPGLHEHPGRRHYQYRTSADYARGTGGLRYGKNGSELKVVEIFVTTRASITGFVARSAERVSVTGTTYKST